MDNNEASARKKLTNETGRDDNQISSMAMTVPDARIVALVRFLARRAAERDYAELIEQSRWGDGSSDF